MWKDLTSDWIDGEQSMRDSFSKYHPIVNMVYFISVLAVTMSCMHPVTQLVNLVCAFLYAVELKGRRTAVWTLRIGLPMILLAAVINPLFNHAGVTILGYFPNGNPLTLESILYGLAAGCMLATVLLWFVCFQEVITTDKLIYLFGKLIPASSLILSMTLRLVPRFRMQLAGIIEAQRMLGRDMTSGNVFKRVKNAITILSILITWSLEDAIETADSMRCRGYGLEGRTAFSIYIMEARDKTALVWILSSGCLLLLYGGICKGLEFRYFPSVYMAPFNIMTVLLQIMNLLLAATPLLIHGKENEQWHFLHLKM